MISKKKDRDLDIAFDVGHSSIGWVVLGNKKPEFLGCGTVIFPADDCLASTRRTFRRQRRHIRSTRLRIERMKRLLEHIGTMKRKELDEPGCAWPWFLAARVLRGGKLLTWPELWDVLRWYAHNRGYDGNRGWSDHDAQAMREDSEKEENAKGLYKKYGTHSMSETFCAVSGLDPLGDKKSCNLSGDKRPKGMNAAFPREDVEAEVRKILEKHIGNLSKVDDGLIESLMKNAEVIPCNKLRLPLRYRGGLLFGQLIPRFENRIIATCPIMFERVYQQNLKETDDRQESAKKAEKFAKVPSKECVEFYAYRWAMQLANIQVVVDGLIQPLIRNEVWRRAVDARMHEQGYFTPKELKDCVRTLTGDVQDNLDQLLLHPDAGDALIVDPLKKLIANHGVLSVIWMKLPERNRKRAAGKWRNGKKLSLDDILKELDANDRTAIETEIAYCIGLDNAKSKKRKEKLSRDQIVGEKLHIKLLQGRAPYHRDIMREAVADVMDRGIHPAEEHGCLYRSEAIRMAQLQRTIDEQTNNHLIRHRLLILERLHGDILKEYAAGDPSRIRRVTIEVNRDLKELSGKTAKKVAQDLGLRLANFKSVIKRLEAAFEGKGVKIAPGLIRKARIAEDIGWTCPYTGIPFDEFDLLNRKVDKDHIIPQVQRPSNSLDSLVITFSEINRWKGRRTALQFVEEEQGNPVKGIPNLSIKLLKNFQRDVDALESFKGHDDDIRRKKNRKRLLQIRDFVDKEFTPRDLTQTSQLVRLGAQALQNAYTRCEVPPVITSIPGSVTGAVRKSWDLLGCLSAANSQVLDEEGNVRTKTEIREITHLHHALDACVLVLASNLFPRDGGIWELLVKRRLNDAEQRKMRACLGNLVEINADGQFRLDNLSAALKEQLRARLAECRVVQHIPKEMTGMSAEQNAWRVVKMENDEVYLRQRIRQPDGSRSLKETIEKAGKVIGLQPGELQKRKAALVISNNYGVALDPQPSVIPFHKVWPRLQELKKANANITPRIIRNGQMIYVPKGSHKGSWRIFSIKNNANGAAFALGRRDGLSSERSKQNVLIRQLLKDGMIVLKVSLVGTALCPTTSSISTAPSVR